MEEKTIKLPPAQLAIVNAKPFSIPYFKQHPYAGWLKAVESFVSDDETRFLLQHVCPVMYKNPVKKDAETCLHLVATNGHIGIALDLSNLPAGPWVEGCLYKMGITKEYVLFTPAEIEADGVPKQFPAIEHVWALPKEKERVEREVSIGGYLGISKKATDDSLGNLAYMLAQEHARINLSYLAKLPLNTDFKVILKKAEEDRNGKLAVLSPIHFINDNMHILLMPMRP